MPHPLPEDIGGVTGKRWFLVAVPDDPAFTRAAMDIYTSMANFWKWGMEGPVPNDSDLAAQLWADAIDETLEALEMGFPDNLLAAVDGVETLLEEIRDKPCCDGDVLYDETVRDGGIIGGTDDDTGDDIVVGVGDPPGGVETWGEYDSKLCDAATKFANGLSDWLIVVQGWELLQSGLTAAILAGLITGLAGLGATAAAIAGAFSFGTILSIIETVRDFLDAGFDFEAAEAELQSAGVINDIICAIVESTTAAEAENAIDTVLTGSAPAAAGAIKLLPLRWLLGRIFNMDSDAAAGFGGGCAECDGIPLPGGFRMVRVSGQEQWVSPGQDVGNINWREVDIDNGVFSLEKKNISGALFTNIRLWQVRQAHSDPLVGIIIDVTNTMPGIVVQRASPVTELTGCTAEMLTANFQDFNLTTERRILQTIQDTQANYPPQETLDAIAADVFPTPQNNKVDQAGNCLSFWADFNGADADFVDGAFTVWLLLKTT